MYLCQLIVAGICVGYMYVFMYMCCVRCVYVSADSCRYVFCVYAYIHTYTCIPCATVAGTQWLLSWQLHTKRIDPF